MYNVVFSASTSNNFQNKKYVYCPGIGGGGGGGGVTEISLLLFN